jgi:hypothetical protein
MEEEGRETGMSFEAKLVDEATPDRFSKAVEDLLNAGYKPSGNLVAYPYNDGIWFCQLFTKGELDDNPNNRP